MFPLETAQRLTEESNTLINFKNFNFFEKNKIKKIIKKIDKEIEKVAEGGGSEIDLTIKYCKINEKIKLYLLQQYKIIGYHNISIYYGIYRSFEYLYDHSFVSISMNWIVIE